MMTELKYKPILGYKFLKETNAKTNWSKQEEQKTKTVNTRKLPEEAK
jgi:hypothetical protein